MKQILGALRRTSVGTVAALFLLTVVGVALPQQQANASGLLYRSLQTSSSAPGDVTPIGSGGDVALPGSAANGQLVSHTYIFAAPTAGSIKGMTFEYCDDPFGYAATCGAIDGFTAANAPDPVVSISNGGTFAGGDLTFTVGSTWTAAGGDSDSLQITNATGITTGSTPATGQFVRVVFTALGTDGFKNPDAAYLNAVGNGNASRSYFAHIVTHTSDTTLDTTTDVDEGTVTSSGANLVTINTRVQETLKFSVGGYGGSADIAQGATNNPTNACVALDTGAAAATMVEGQLTMGDNNQSLAANAVSTTKSYFRLATNSSRGAKVLYAGQTLKSTAGDTITALAAQAAADDGVEQFGLTVLAPDSGTPSPTTYEDYTALAPATGYDDPAQYNFSTASNTAPVVLAESTGVVACDTVPVQYVANISNETPAGLYSTKISYIAVPSY